MIKKLFILLFISLNIFAGTVVDKNTKINTEIDKNSEKEKILFIKVSDISEYAAQLQVKLKKIQELTKIPKESENIKLLINPYYDSVSDLLLSEDYQNIKYQELLKLQSMQSELAGLSKQLVEWSNIMQSRTKLYDENRKILNSYHVLWTQTNSNAVDKDAPSAILKQVELVLVYIEDIDSTLKKNYDNALTYSQKITTQISLIEEVSVAIKQRTELLKNKIFFQNQEIIFTAFLTEKFSIPEYIDGVKFIYYQKYQEVLVYFQTHDNLTIELIIVNIFGLFFIFYFAFLYNKKKLFLLEESYSKRNYYFIKNIFSISTLFFTLSIVFIYPDRPIFIANIMLLILVIPFIRIIRTLIDTDYYKYIYIFFTLYVAFAINKYSSNTDFESRIYLLFINIFLIVYIFYVIKNNVINIIENKRIIKFIKYGLFSFLFLLLISFFSNIYGSVLLSSRIIDGVLLIILASLVFYILYIVLAGYVVIVLRKRISTASYMIDKYSHNIESTTKFLIKIWMILWWILSIIKFLGINHYLLDIKNEILTASWEVGKTVISVQSIFDFLIIVFGTWFLSKLIKTVLEVEVFARFKFPRGFPTAVITTLNYTVIISGTILAFSSLGITSQQFAIVIGALGVGIGFGLRNIIANFVSGIIMVFERPIQIGDTIVVDGTMGDVQSIGARASVIKTFDGSEVIIPNADFIAKEIINWTLTDKQRRKTFEFKVALDNDIDKVLDIMNNIATLHVDVLEDPEAVATFQGFGEYYMNFKLYFWLSDNIISAQSEIAIGIYKALKDADIKMPVQTTHLKNNIIKEEND